MTTTTSNRRASAKIPAPVHVARKARSAKVAFDEIGAQAVFYRNTIAEIPIALKLYRRETLRLLAEVSMGSGALAVIGGTVVIVGFLTLSAGATVAVQGYSSLGDIGVEALTGFFAAFVNVRIAAPVVAGIGLAATIGAGATAQIGAMRISEEIDALEVIGVRSVPYLASTRVVAGMIVIIPLYSVAVLASFLASRTATVVIYGQSAGVYDHYFATFLVPSDLLWSFLQATLMALVVMLIHTYFGYTASGGPAGVGEAVGRAVRASLAAVVMVTLMVSLAVYGTSGNFNFAG
ncbi:ABC-transporter integral membrane protein [Rhodococcus opacus PD630]|uniref:ABC transporter permease n=1 Tax=Rhodococcus opacus TaxID=37919 RepID=UPI00029CC525|nr:ABC transporter permease [Rhodococcus opacus]AHK36153.1 Protein TRIGALACTOSYLDIACYLGLYCEROL 1 [Rhodococcus opacus PD630]EHI43643.1 ABC-transporter integral membrane protein [Rhodococcus opacus PD630]UDH01231.1 ABC transporter permease [Rhodococcus opacus PD630]